MARGDADGLPERQRHRVRAVLELIERQRQVPGLAERERLGLQVLAETLGNALQSLRALPPRTESQAAHLAPATEALIAAGDRLGFDARPAEIAGWRAALDPAVRLFARTVLELPHR